MKAKHSIFIFVLLNALGYLNSSDTDCISFDVLLTQNIDNTGFHRYVIVNEYSRNSIRIS